MELDDVFAQMGGLQTVASELGVSQQQAANGAAALLPAILGGLKRQAQAQPSGAGLDGLVGMLNSLGGGALLDDVLGPQPTNVGRGNDVLGQIFGSKDVSRTVAQAAASRSGLDASVLKKMLPMLAMMVAGYMAKQGVRPAAGGGGLGDLLGGLLGGGSRSGGGLASLLDFDGDGNPLDDIMRMAGKMFR